MHQPKALKTSVLTYAEDGYARVEIHAALAETYRGQTKITKIKDSLKVYFFNESGDIVSTLSALYGEINYNTGELMVQDSCACTTTKSNKRLKQKPFFGIRKTAVFLLNPPLLCALRRANFWKRYPNQARFQ